MKEFIGAGSLADLLAELTAQGNTRVFLVTGRDSYTTSPAKEMVDAFVAGKACEHFYDFAVNPKEADALIGAERFRAFAPDCVLAIGGGSVMDMAKLIVAASANEDDLRGLLNGSREFVRGDVSLYAVPTTSGSGSESTQFAIIYVEGAKFSLSFPQLRANGVALDPALSASMSPYLTACTGFDALAQAIESYWSGRSSEESRQYSLQAITHILPNLVAAVNEPTPAAREAMAVGSMLAGKAINMTTTTIAHALSYYLTTNYNVPHGHAVALTLGRFFAGNGITTQGRLQEGIDAEEYAQRMQVLYAALGCQNAEEAEALWYGMMSQCGLATSLSDVGLDSVHDIVMQANMQRLKNNPVVFTHDALKELLAPLV